MNEWMSDDDGMGDTRACSLAPKPIAHTGAAARTDEPSMQSARTEYAEVASTLCQRILLAFLRNFMSLLLLPPSSTSSTGCVFSLSLSPSLRPLANHRGDNK